MTTADPIARLQELAWPSDRVFHGRGSVTVWSASGRVRLTRYGADVNEAARLACDAMEVIRAQARDEARKWMLAYDSAEARRSTYFLCRVMRERHHDHGAPGVAAAVMARIEQAHITGNSAVY